MWRDTAATPAKRYKIQEISCDTCSATGGTRNRVQLSAQGGTAKVLSWTLVRRNGAFGTHARGFLYYRNKVFRYGAHPILWADLMQKYYFFPSFIVKNAQNLEPPSVGTPQTGRLLNGAFGPPRNSIRHSLGVCHTDNAKHRHVPGGFVKTSTTIAIFNSAIRTDLDALITPFLP